MAGEGRFAADAAQFGSAMNSINHSQVMMAAINDYQKDLLAKQEKETVRQEAIDINGFLDDAELQKLHEERISKLKEAHEKRAQLQLKGHGQLQDITEGEFLEIVTKADMVVCHFFHRDFERCKIMDKHLTSLARKYFSTRFIKLSAPDSPFFTVKLNVRVLPCVLLFKHGVAVDRITGFESLGGIDDFEVAALEDRMYQAEVVEEPDGEREEKEDSGREKPNNAIRKGFSSFQKTASDEDSDFE